MSEMPRAANDLKPLKISIENCNELLSDARRRKLGAHARAAAEAGSVEIPELRSAVTYFDGVVREHEILFWMDAYQKRRRRMERKARRYPR